MILNSLDRFRDLGLLILRIGTGIIYVLVHGGPKIFAGPERWEGVGGAMANLGINFGHTFWGFMAAFAEFAGGLLLIIGLFFRPAVILMFLTMAIATYGHATGAIPGGPWHSGKMAILFLSLLLVGPGKYSFDARLSPRTRLDV